MTTFEPWRAGQIITADRLNATAPLAWKSWTPVWSTTDGSSVSTYGNAEINCRYVQFGLFVQFMFDIIFGSTTNFVTGANWTFGLPVTAARSDAPIGYASMYTGDTAKAASGLANLYDTSRFLLYIASANVNNTAQAGGIADSAAPSTWVAGNRLSITGQYQAAA